MFDEQPDGDPHGECAHAINELRMQLALVLPMAKAHATAHPVGSNADIVRRAEEVLRSHMPEEDGRGTVRRFEDDWAPNPNDDQGTAGGKVLPPVPEWVPVSESWRWNIERDGDALLVCFNQHNKGQPCEVVRYVPESTRGVLGTFNDQGEKA